MKEEFDYVMLFYETSNNKWIILTTTIVENHDYNIARFVFI